MRNAIFTATAILLLASCAQKEPNPVLGSYESMNEELPYKGRARFTLNGKDSNAFTRASYVQLSSGERRWFLVIHTFSAPTVYVTQRVLENNITIGNLKTSAYSVGLQNMPLYPNDRLNEQEDVDWKKFGNDVSGTDPVIISGQPNDITIESFDAQTGHYKGRFNLTAKDPMRLDSVLEVRNGVFEGNL